MGFGCGGLNRRGYGEGVCEEAAQVAGLLAGNVSVKE
jgi:hypothetical protein